MHQLYALGSSVNAILHEGGVKIDYRGIEVKLINKSLSLYAVTGGLGRLKEDSCYIYLLHAFML